MGSYADFKDCDLKLAKFFEDLNEFEFGGTCETELAITLFSILERSLVFNP